MAHDLEDLAAIAPKLGEWSRTFTMPSV